ncbi:hypothetical protein QBC36DRAFT_352149 [Triangularia setosa]|uniref:Uncharacterized protein n=1 Tax=Triangularia setosa TaxID=2587417 RepID=A0AAN6W7N0_9PEZI|nr:hypothetical protein QBC36DRAFT_352149 [Podospora setosa]
MLSKVFCAIAAPVVLFAQLAHGGLVTPTAPFKGYTVFDVEWQLPIDPKNAASKSVTVTGTIQEAVAKMDAAYPGWNETFLSTISRNQPGTSLSDNPKRDHYVCNPDDGEKDALYRGIAEGITYLRRIGDGDVSPPQNNPHGCGRISCTNYSGIWWCNNNNFEKQVTWQEIGDSAYFLAYQCGIWNDITWLTAGEEFFKDKWSVYVTATAC